MRGSYLLLSFVTTYVLYHGEYSVSRRTFLASPAAAQPHKGQTPAAILSGRGRRSPGTGEPGYTAPGAAPFGQHTASEDSHSSSHDGTQPTVVVLRVRQVVQSEHAVLRLLWAAMGPGSTGCSFPPAAGDQLSVDAKVAAPEVAATETSAPWNTATGQGCRPGQGQTGQGRNAPAPADSGDIHSSHVAAGRAPTGCRAEACLRRGPADAGTLGGFERGYVATDTTPGSGGGDRKGGGTSGKTSHEVYARADQGHGLREEAAPRDSRRSQATGQLLGGVPEPDTAGLGERLTEIRRGHPKVRRPGEGRQTEAGSGESRYQGTGGPNGERSAGLGTGRDLRHRAHGYDTDLRNGCAGGKQGRTGQQKTQSNTRCPAEKAARSGRRYTATAQIAAAIFCACSSTSQGRSEEGVGCSGTTGFTYAPWLGHHSGAQGSLPFHQVEHGNGSGWPTHFWHSIEAEDDYLSPEAAMTDAFLWSGLCRLQDFSETAADDLASTQGSSTLRSRWFDPPDVADAERARQHDTACDVVGSCAPRQLMGRAVRESTDSLRHNCAAASGATGCTVSDVPRRTVQFTLPPEIFFLPSIRDPEPGCHAVNDVLAEARQALLEAIGTFGRATYWDDPVQLAVEGGTATQLQVTCGVHCAGLPATSLAHFPTRSQPVHPCGSTALSALPPQASPEVSSTRAGLPSQVACRDVHRDFLRDGLSSPCIQKPPIRFPEPGPPVTPTKAPGRPLVARSPSTIAMFRAEAIEVHPPELRAAHVFSSPANMYTWGGSMGGTTGRFTVFDHLRHATVERCIASASLAEQIALALGSVPFSAGSVQVLVHTVPGFPVPQLVIGELGRPATEAPIVWDLRGIDEQVRTVRHVSRQQRTEALQLVQPLTRHAESLALHVQEGRIHMQDALGPVLADIQTNLRAIQHFTLTRTRALHVAGSFPGFPEAHTADTSTTTTAVWITPVNVQGPVCRLALLRGTVGYSCQLGQPHLSDVAIWRLIQRHGQDSPIAENAWIALAKAQPMCQGHLQDVIMVLIEAAPDITVIWDGRSYDSVIQASLFSDAQRADLALPAAWRDLGWNLAVNGIPSPHHPRNLRHADYVVPYQGHAIPQVVPLSWILGEYPTLRPFAWSFAVHSCSEGYHRGLRHRRQQMGAHLANEGTVVVHGPTHGELFLFTGLHRTLTASDVTRAVGRLQGLPRGLEITLTPRVGPSASLAVRTLPRSRGV